MFRPTFMPGRPHGTTCTYLRHTKRYRERRRAVKSGWLLCHDVRKRIEVEKMLNWALKVHKDLWIGASVHCKVAVPTLSLYWRFSHCTSSLKSRNRRRSRCSQGQGIAFERTAELSISADLFDATFLVSISMEVGTTVGEISLNHVDLACKLRIVQM
jgi:hypothetical protein